MSLAISSDRVLCLQEPAKTKVSLADHWITAFYSTASYAMQHHEIHYRVSHYYSPQHYAL